MQFKTERERKLHPKAGLIPEELWATLYQQTLTDEDASDFDTPLEELAQKDYADWSKDERGKTWFSVLLSHRETKADHLLAFARDTLQLDVTDIVGYAIYAGNLGVFKEATNDLRPAQLKETIKMYDSCFETAIANGHLEIADYLEVTAPKTLQKLLTRKEYKLSREAAQKGQVGVLRYIAEKVPGSLKEMIDAKKFELFRRAAASGALDVLRYIEEKAPKRLQKMIEAKKFEAFRGAAQSGDLDVLRYLEEKAPGRLQEMIAAENFNAYLGAIQLGHLDVVLYLEGKVPVQQRQRMITAKEFNTFGGLVFYSTGNLEIINHLMTHASNYSYAERHTVEPIFHGYVTRHTEDFLDRLQQQITDFERDHPHGVFDFASGDAAKDAHQALYGYYVLRHLIRQLNDNRFGDAVYGKITRLLEIPSIKDLLLRNVTQTSLPADHPLGVFDFAQQPNELLRLAINCQDERVTQQLLSIPAVRAEAERHGFYADAGGLDLAALARDRESSMTGLTPEEEKLLAKIERAYKPAILEHQDGVEGVLNDLREDAKNAFLAQENLSKRQVTLREGQLTLDLPFEYEAFLELTQRHALSDEEIQKAKTVYYDNIYHTAWRYIAKPNPWMDQNASYVYVNDARTERWSTFEEYRPFIAFLYLAAKDETRPPTEKDSTVQDRVTLFMRALALINRQHNWDERRVRYADKDKKIPKRDTKGAVLTEEFDDGKGDRPSCYSGVKRNLFQALIGHPLYKPLNAKLVTEFIQTEIWAHYVELLKGRSREDLIAIKTDAENRILDGDAETPLLISLRWSGKEAIQAKMEAILKEDGVPYYPLIDTVLLLGGKTENTFIGYYGSLEFGELLDKLIAVKSFNLAGIREEYEIDHKDQFFKSKPLQAEIEFLTAVETFCQKTPTLSEEQKYQYRLAATQLLLMKIDAEVYGQGNHLAEKLRARLDGKGLPEEKIPGLIDQLVESRVEIPAHLNEFYEHTFPKSSGAELRQ